MKKFSAICLLLALTFCAPQSSKNVAQQVPAGNYKLDKTHASLIFRVDHLGFSNYTARFKNFDATLDFDPANPTKSRVEATVDVASLETDFPNSKKINFNKMLQSNSWLGAAKFPKIKFVSKEIKITGKNSADIIGELSLHGVTHPLTLNATFNGGYASHPMDPSGARIGFSAKGSLNRSDFGIAFGIPAAGTKMGVSDKVEIILEVEFNKPVTKNFVPKSIPKPVRKVIQ